MRHAFTTIRYKDACFKRALSTGRAWPVGSSIQRGMHQNQCSLTTAAPRSPLTRSTRLHLHRNLQRGGSPMAVCFTTTTTRNEDQKRSRDEIYAIAIQGRRPHMEDEYIAQHDTVDESLGQNGGAILAAVFDGHGGTKVSAYLQQELYPTILRVASASSLLQLQSQSVEQCISFLTTSLNEIDQNVLDKRKWDRQGSTAVTAWLHRPSPSATHLIVANIGDSRAVLGQVVERTLETGETEMGVRSIQMTRDHKPDDPDEKHRIEEIHGGRVIYSIMDVPRVNGVLALSRAIGDGDDRPFVSAEPEITTFEVGLTHLFSKDDDNSNTKVQGKIMDEFLILATDGLWDTMTSQDAIQFVAAHSQKGTSRQEIPQKLATAALELGSYDNITVVVLWIASNQQQQPQEENE